MARDGRCISDKNVGMSESAMAQDKLCVRKHRNIGVGIDIVSVIKTLERRSWQWLGIDVASAIKTWECRSQQWLRTNFVSENVGMLGSAMAWD